MRQLMRWCGCGALVAGMALAATSGAAEPIYSWTTEDGVFAYSDNPKKIPARYKAKMREVTAHDLENYPRFTRQDAAATGRYAERLAERLTRLRAINAPEATAALPTVNTQLPMLSVRTGQRNAPSIAVPTDGTEPLIVESLVTRKPGDAATRRTTVVRQGGRTVAIVRGSRHHRNPNSDVIDERDL